MTALALAFVAGLLSILSPCVLPLVPIVLGAAVMIVATLVFLNGEGIVNWVGGVLRLTNVTMWVWKIVQFPVALCGLVGLSFITLYLLPNVKQQKGHVAFVSVLITAFWIAATLVFRALGSSV